MEELRVKIENEYSRLLKEAIENGYDVRNRKKRRHRQIKMAKKNMNKGCFTMPQVFI